MEITKVEKYQNDIRKGFSTAERIPERLGSRATVDY